MSEEKKNEDQETPEESTAIATVETEPETEEQPNSDEPKEFEFAEDPVFDIDYKGECAYEVKVTVPEANQKKQADELFGQLKSEADIPGFRKGRAPRNLIEKKFSKAVRGETIDKLVNAAFRKLIKDEELRPIDTPDIDGLEEVADKKDDEPLKFTLKFEVAPRCELGKYRGLEIEKPVLKISDEETDAAILEMRGRFATFETVEEGGAEAGDQLIIDFKGTIDGEEFEGGAAENYPYILGSKRFFAEFEEALQGAESGAELTCDVPFPEDYASTELAGNTATFAIKVNEIKRRVVPELDDDLAKQAGFDSADAMREKVAKDLQDRAEADSKSVLEANAVKQIVEDSTFELPKSLVESSANEYYEQERRRLMALHMPAAEIEQRDEQIRNEARESAISNIKSFVVMNELADAEGIEVTEEDFEKEAEAIQERTGMEMDVVQNYLAQDDQRDSYESRLYRQKAMQVVLDAATITEKKVNLEELRGNDESAGA